MGSFSRILAHEWRVLARERTMWALAALLVVLIVGGVRNGAAWAAQQRTTLAAIAAHDDALYARLEAQTRVLETRDGPAPNLPVAGMAWYLAPWGKEPPPAPHLDPRRPEAAGSEWGAARYAVLPPDSLAAMAIGQSDLHPYYSRVTIRTRPVLLNNDEIENPLALLNGRFDLAFVLVFCWPLVALPLAYDLLSQERDGGTLPLALSQPVTLRRLAAAKVTVRAGVLAAVTIVASLAALWLTGSLHGPDIIPKLAAWVPLVLATATLWFGVALLVNTAGWRSSTNAVVLASIWLGAVLVVPALLNVLITTVAPVPSRVELMSEMRTATNAATGDVAKLVAHYYEDHPEFAPPDATPQRNAVRSVALQDEAERRVQPALDRFDASVGRQDRLAARVRYASPPMLIQEAMNDLAGTSTGRYRRFMAQLEQHHRRWRAFFYPRIYQQTAISASDYARMPRFTYDPEPLASVVARAAANIAIVLALGLVGFAWGLRRLLRYPIVA
jgi:ABC-2 type transport system permease protein